MRFRAPMKFFAGSVGWRFVLHLAFSDTLQLPSQPKKGLASTIRRCELKSLNESCSLSVFADLSLALNTATYSLNLYHLAWRTCGAQDEDAMLTVA